MRLRSIARVACVLGVTAEGCFVDRHGTAGRPGMGIDASSDEPGRADGPWHLDDGGEDSGADDAGRDEPDGCVDPCDEGAFCYEGRCVCPEGACCPPCGPAHVCLGGRCEARACDPPCTDGRVCIEGYCRCPDGACCPPCTDGRRCESGSCVCPPGACCPPCVSPATCMGGTCSTPPPPPPECGRPGLACCDEWRCDLGAVCDRGTCVACGGRGQRCCPGFSNWCTLPCWCGGERCEGFC
ncbi:MAG: hypothetical protein NZ898_01285 [Myxococcota bacterium]|nr:hypothetical protein [Myxococcota bacterium]